MKKLITFVVVAAAVVLVVPRVWERFEAANAADGARRRVERMVTSMTAQPRDEQTALCTWAAGTMLLPREEMSRHLPGWTAFWSGSGLEGGSDWSVASVEGRPDGAHLVVLEGAAGRVSLLVRPDEPIELVDG